MLVLSSSLPDVAARRNQGMLILLHGYSVDQVESSTLLLGKELLGQAMPSDPCIHGGVAQLLELSGDYTLSAVEWSKYDDECRRLEELAVSHANSGDWGSAMIWWDRAASAAGRFDPGLIVTPQHSVLTSAALFSLVRPDGYFQRSTGRITLFTNRAVAQAFYFPTAGQYCLSIRALNSVPGPVLIEASLGSDRLSIAEFAREDNLWSEHSWRVEIGRPGRYILTLAFLNDEVTQFSDRNAVLGSVVWQVCQGAR